MICFSSFGKPIEFIDLLVYLGISVPDFLKQLIMLIRGRIAERGKAFIEEWINGVSPFKNSIVII